MTGPRVRNPGFIRRATNVAEVHHRVSPAARVARNGHIGAVLWLTGLSGAGKSTLGVELERWMFARGYQAYMLDGDNLRHGLNADLGFSPDERGENIRRVGEVSALFARAGFVVITALISPYRIDRACARAAAGEVPFHEIHVKAALAICETRDPKGLYRRARRGEIADFTGVSAPYEAPEAAELVVDTGRLDVAASVALLSGYVGRSVPLARSDPQKG
jgi:bifunctional enzyme CysN/CysC